MTKKKLIGITLCGVGFTILVFSLFFIFSIFSTFSGAKFFSSLVSIFLGSRFFPPIGMTVFGITMLIFSLVSIFLGSRFFLYSWLQFYYKIAQLLILVSGLVFIGSSIFLPRLKNWTRKLVINYSGILLFYFIPLLSIFLIAMLFQHDPLGGASYDAFAFIVYTISPFFIIFLTRPNIKEQFKN